MLFRTPAMVSFTRAKGSLMVQLGVRSHAFTPLKQEVMNSGPSMAWITSKAEICRASREQRVAAVHSGMRTQKAHLGEPLQDLGQELCGDSVGVRNVLGAQGGRFRVLGQVLERHEPVIRFFGEL